MNILKMANISPNMKEAMKLIKTGQLQEATEAIQRNLKCGSGATPDNTVSADSSASQYVQPIFNNLPNISEITNITDRMSNLKLVLPNGLDNGIGFKQINEETLPEGARFLKKSLTDDQGNHDYRLYIPSSYQQDLVKGLELPLVIMLHGCTQSPEDFAAGTRMNQLAEEHHCLIAYPAQPVSANQNRCWNWFQPKDQQQGQGEPAWLAALTRTVTEDYAVDSSRVYIAGLSAGAAMAIIMAETNPELYAAIGVHSGLAYRSANSLPSALMAMRHGSTSSESQSNKNNPFVPMIVFHGDQDPTVSIRNGEQIFDQANLRLQAQKTELKTHQEQHCSKQSCNSTQKYVSNKNGINQLEYWKIHGTGHSWAGGSNSGSHTDPSGPDASKEMMRFLLKHKNAE